MQTILCSNVSMALREQQGHLLLQPSWRVLPAAHDIIHDISYKNKKCFYTLIMRRHANTEIVVITVRITIAVY